jgi:DNA-directed RNA polymerase omega subunit
MVVMTRAPESQFAYVLLVARRARQLMSGAIPLVENPRARKPTRVAEDEVQKGLIEYEMGSKAEAEAAEVRRRS